jgi:hypothetical protein
MGDFVVVAALLADLLASLDGKFVTRHRELHPSGRPA